MKSKFLNFFISCLTVFILLLGVLPVSADAVGQAQTFTDGITEYKLNQSSADSVQDWINGELSENAGKTSEWYIIALSQNGKYDFSSYEKALLEYLSKNEIYSASSRQKYALALAACGSTDSYIYATLNDSIGEQGIMSWVFGLHLLNNGYTAKEFTVGSVKKKILSLQLSDGGWAISGNYGNADVTAMAVQALAPYYKSDTEVKSAVNNALKLLSSSQQSDGGYKNYGTANPESTAQVLVALSALSIDCKTDSRFIKNGNTLFDAMSKYRLSNGAFCHQSGGDYNESATVQSFYSSVSYLRMLKGDGGFYILDNANPQGLKIPEENEVQNDKDKTASEVSSDNNSSVTGGKNDSSSSEKTNSASRSTSSVNAETDKTTIDYKDKNVKTESSNDKSNSEKTPSAIPEENTISDTSGIENSDTQGNSSDGAVKTETDGISSETKADKAQSKTLGYKFWVCLALIVIAGGACLVLYCLKKRNKTNFIVVLAIALAAVVFVLITNFSTADTYYNANSQKQNTIGTVTIAIRCDTVKGRVEHIAENGVILETSELEICEGDTVYDALKTVTAENKIHMETNGSAGSVYVEGIGNIYEFDFGDLSGWVFFVNGERPSVSCGEYKLSAGDKIEWHYTCELGEDLDIKTE